MDIYQSMGLEVHLGSVGVQAGQRWVSEIDPGFWVGTVLDGTVETRTSHFGKREWTPFTSTCFWAKDKTESAHHALETCEMAGVFIRIAPENVEQIIGERTLSLMDDGRVSQDVSKCPSAIKALSWQMLACPIEGDAKRLYVVSRALDILSQTVAHKEESSRHNAVATAQMKMRAGDIERLHEARRVLLADLQTPPTVPELARLVGMNARKLGQGFSQLFGLPVYAWLKEERLTHARVMLESGAYRSVSEAAYRTGYNSAHFSTEFKRRFGHSPSHILAQEEA